MYSTLNLISDIWSYVFPYRNNFLLATFFRIISDLSWLYPPFAFAVIVNFFSNYTPGKPLAPLYIAFFFMIIAAILRYGGQYYAKTIMFRLAEKVALDAQYQSIEHLMLLDMSWHEKESSGSKFKRIERGADSLNRILRMWMNNIIEITINLIGIIIIIINFNLQTGIAITVFLFTYFLLSGFHRKRAVAVSNIVNAKEENRSGLLFESINNIRSVKAMSMSPKILRLLSVNADDLITFINKRIYWFQSGNNLRNFYAQIFKISTMAYIVYSILQGRQEIGFLILFTGYFDRAWMSMTELTDVSEDFAVYKNAIHRMQTIRNTPITIDDETQKIKFPSDWHQITIENISYSYGDKPALDNISFDIKRGEKIGIIGLSGAGKSTLFKLLLKERESYSGNINFDNTPLKTISKKDYLSHLAIVLQETELFNATLRDNITITNYREENNEELFQKALDIAHINDFLSKLPRGINTIIGEKGIKLSGGEKQRVGIGRAIFKKPQILLLDEATSHLDIESEKRIQDSLHRFFQNVTAIVIAHRLTTIKEMDKIIVIENGKIIESGSFTHLHNSKGRFYELWEQQKL